jgi:para-nitrobenzyl esterase
MDKLIVETRYGKLRGTREGSVCAWKGIPYAKPPVGDLRFRPPQEPEPWAGVRDATEFGAIPWQDEQALAPDMGRQTFRMSEDCLTLNVWSPAADGKKRPVMLWIHGGSFTSGSGSLPVYNGASFAAVGDIVFVTVNYRLGVLGFLYLGEVAGEEYATSGNNGILDQIAALRWVRDNIEAFGGDPDQVTIFGESAGAGSVATLLAMPAAKGLFHRAILMSGSHRHMFDIETASGKTRAALQWLGISADQWHRLKELDPKVLTELTTATSMKGMSYVTVVDGISIPKHPLDVYKEGFSKDIPTMMGTTLDEMRLMYVTNPGWANFPDDATAIGWFEDRFGPFPEAIRSYYLNMELPGEPFVHKLVNLISYQSFTFPALQMAEQQVRNGAPVWMYRFGWRGDAMNGLLGACHACELPYVFNTLDSPWAEAVCGTNPDKNLAMRMHRAWIAFARNGDPNTADLPFWPQYNLEERPTMLFNTETKLAHDPAREERLLWESCAQ